MKNLLLLLVAVVALSCSRPQWFETRSDMRQRIRDGRSWHNNWMTNGRRSIKEYPSISH